MDTCPEVRASLTVEEAEAVLEPYFLAVQEIFVGNGATKCKRVKLEIAPWLHDSPRHFAATEDTGKVMIVSPEFAELPEETVVAILSHEFGHAVEFWSTFSIQANRTLVSVYGDAGQLISRMTESEVE